MNEPESYEKLKPSEVTQLGENKDIEGLINVLKYNNTGTCIEFAANWLGNLKVEKAIAPLLEVASKSEAGIAVREAAVLALGNIGNHKVVEPLIYLMGKHDYLRRAVAEALGRLKDDRAVKPLNMLMNDENEDQYVREMALEALCKIGTQEAITNVIAVLDGNLGEKASSSLKELGEAAIQPLISALNSENQTKAVEILGEIGNKQAAEPLLAMLETYITNDFITKDFCFNPKNLSGFVRAIVKINDAVTTNKTVEMLINASKPNPMQTDDDYAFQCHLIFALGDTLDKRVIKPLVHLLLQSNDSTIIYTAAYALATMGSKIEEPTVIQQLIGVLEGDRKYEGIRNYIAWALLQIDENKTAIPLLKYLRGNYIEMLRKTLFPDPDMMP